MAAAHNGGLYTYQGTQFRVTHESVSQAHQSFRAAHGYTDMHRSGFTEMVGGVVNTARSAASLGITAGGMGLRGARRIAQTMPSIAQRLISRTPEEMAALAIAGSGGASMINAGLESVASSVAQSVAHGALDSIAAGALLASPVVAAAALQRFRTRQIEQQMVGPDPTPALIGRPALRPHGPPPPHPAPGSGVVPPALRPYGAPPPHPAPGSGVVPPPLRPHGARDRCIRIA